MNGKTLHMIGNAHLDPVWLWQWPEGFHEIKATFRSALDRMKEYDDFIFISSSAAYYAWVEENEPEMFAEIRQRVAEGRWGLVGGWWVQPDCNLPGGESFVRQGLHGQRYFKEKFGKTARVGYNVDSFGHHAMLPQILKKSGLDYYVFMRPMPHEKGLPGRLFWWEADDCSRVLAFRIPFEYGTGAADLENHVRRCAAELKEPVNGLMCFYGVGNHGGGPTRANINSILRLQGEDSLPELRFSTPEAYFTEIEAGGLRLPVVHDELQHHASGCYAAHSGIKRWNRQAENALLCAEKWASVASRITGLAYPAEALERAWKNVLFNQFHDILAGTSVEAAYEDASHQLGEAMSIAGRATNAAIQSLSWRIKIESEEGLRPLVVFNPHAWDAKLPVEVEMGSLREGDVLLNPAGEPVPFQQVQPAATAKGRTRLVFVASLPALGYKVYRITSRPVAAEAEPIHATDTEMENERFLLEIDAVSGAIKSLWDKKNQLEVFGGPAAQPVVLDDPSDTWAHNVFRFDKFAGVFTARSVRLVEHGPVKSVIRVVSEYGASRLVQDFAMYRRLEQIEVSATLDWREHFKVLKLRFPLHLNHMRAVSEIPYGQIERFASGEEEPGQTWLDVSGSARDTGIPYGFSLLNDSKYSYDVNIRDIGMTILRSPVYANHLPVIPDSDGHYSFVDQGIQRFRYTLLPHEGALESSGAVRRAQELNQPPVTLPATFHLGDLPQEDSYLSAGPENIVVTVLKRAEDGDDLILRAYETAHCQVQATIRLPHWGREITATFGPAEIKTFRIPADPSLPVVENNLLEWEAEDYDTC